MRDAESLMEVEVGDVSSIVPWPAETRLRVHVGTVHIHLPCNARAQRGQHTHTACQPRPHIVRDSTAQTLYSGHSA